MSRNARNFILTTYNIEKEELVKILTPIVENAVFQQERCPKTDRLHWQIYIKTKQPFSFRKLKPLLPNNTHVESTRSPKKAAMYCQKQDTRVDGPFFIGSNMEHKSTWDELRERIQRRELDTIIDKQFPLYIRHRRAILDELAKQQLPVSFNHCRGIWISGPTGCGKTRTCNELPIYWKPLNKWWDGYDGQRYVLFDDIDSDIWKWAINYIKLWTDHYPVRGEIKGGYTHLNYEWFICTSNQTLDESLANTPLNHIPAIKRRFIEFKTTSTDWCEQFKHLIL